jgi:hypothetical protein
MPPCPAPPGDNCVPLAVVTVSVADGCKVQSICNWTTQRKYVTTFPSLQYWLSFLPFGRLLREAIEGLCCKSFLKVDKPESSVPQPELEVMARVEAAPGGGSPGSAPGTSASDLSPSSYFRGSAQTMTRNRDFMQLALQSLAARDQSATVEQLVLGMIGDRDAKGDAPLSELESENLLQFLVLDQMAKPTLRNLLSADTFGGEAFTAFAGAAARAQAPGDVGAQLDELRATVERQQKQIDELLRAAPRGRKK